MSNEILKNLTELQNHSNKSVHANAIAQIKVKIQGNPRTLVKQKLIASAKYATTPKDGVEPLLKGKNIQSVRKIITLSAGQEGNLTFALNTSLLGGKSYPILTAVLGTVAGMASFGSGLMFSAMCTGLSLAQTSQRVLARSGDELWHIEEIGKVRSGSSYKAVYVSSFFIIDPYRKQAGNKGWLIHEEREDLTLA